MGLGRHSTVAQTVCREQAQASKQASKQARERQQADLQQVGCGSGHLLAPQQRRISVRLGEAAPQQMGAPLDAGGVRTQQVAARRYACAHAAPAFARQQQLT